jgi:hypothetical protein
MKKVLSISLVLLMLTAMLHLSVATHYCGGKIAASKISLSGELASCGMEGEGKEIPLPETNLFAHCCDDIVTFCRIDNNYSPSFTVFPESFKNQLHIFGISTGLPVHSITIQKTLFTSASPPDAFASTGVDLSDICVFRI